MSATVRVVKSAVRLPKSCGKNTKFAVNTRVDINHSISKGDLKTAIAISSSSFSFGFSPIRGVVVVVDYPTPSKGWGHGGRPWSPRSRATLQGLDQRSYRDRESPKSERRKESVAGQCRMR